jgi:hypothetical protein
MEMESVVKKLVRSAFVGIDPGLGGFVRSRVSDTKYPVNREEILRQ